MLSFPWQPVLQDVALTIDEQFDSDPEPFARGAYGDIVLRGETSACPNTDLGTEGQDRGKQVIDEIHHRPGLLAE